MNNNSPASGVAHDTANVTRDLGPPDPSLLLAKKPRVPGQSSSKGVMIAALGVVFGDIGTSPYYALRECFAPARGIHPTPDNVIGILSLVLWSMMLIISVQYVAIIMKS